MSDTTRNDGPAPRAMITRRGAVGVASGLAMAGVAAGAAAADRAPKLAARSGPESLLYPHESASRTSKPLAPTWRFRADPQDVGEAEGWQKGLRDFRLIPVPASWNDIFDDMRNYVGSAWYETEFRVDKAWAGQRIHLRFGSVTYTAKVWLNGKPIGGHVGGNLPFGFDITDAVSMDGENVLTVLVENKIRLDRVPATPDTARWHLHTAHFPQTAYDFFPYSGVHRPVLLYTTPDVHLYDVTVRTSLDGRIAVDLEASAPWSGQASVVVSDGKRSEKATITLSGGKGSGVVTVKSPRLWSPEDPHLYTLTVRLENGAASDEYAFKIGVRTIEAKGDKLLLNGKPVFLRGFGKHEDFPIHGRGLDVASIVRDFELLKWIGGNSFRTSHYPYSEEAMMLADEHGLLVIDETPAVSLVFADPPEIQEARFKQLRQDIVDLVRRDKNHPCVIMWSLANEPLVKPFHTIDPEPAGGNETGLKFFSPLFDLTRQLDATRPVTIVSVQGGSTDWQALGDVVCTNSYQGWYSLSGQLDRAEEALKADVAKLRARHPNKPIMFTEFGADAVAGMHSHPPEMWTEEYQADMVEMYIRVLETFPFIFGTHPWAFADFRTSQSIMRIGAQNHKGLFTRDRKPKLAAHRARALWSRPAQV
ncbi:MAG: beta-glucuronidase [Caulobacter sp.]|nr:beta-glucuronidase [Caulobacter sp.]